MIRPPPRSPLFPSTPLSRSDSAAADIRDRYASLSPREQQVMTLVTAGKMNKQVAFDLGLSEITVKTYRGRSEEHTSELQSQSNLVCRLLLEKKKNTSSDHSRSSTSEPNTDTVSPTSNPYHPQAQCTNIHSRTSNSYTSLSPSPSIAGYLWYT